MNMIDPHGVSPLMCAAFGGHTKVVKLLLRSKAAPHGGAIEWAQLAALPYSYDDDVTRRQDRSESIEDSRKTVRACSCMMPPRQACV